METCYNKPQQCGFFRILYMHKKYKFPEIFSMSLLLGLCQLIKLGYIENYLQI